MFNLFNVQNLIGLYALYNIRQQQMLALAASNRRRRMQRRRNRRFRFWCLPRPRQSWFEIYYDDHQIPDGFFKQQLRVRRETFNQLLNNVSPHVARQDTSMRNCVQKEVDRPTRLLQFVAFVHSPFSFRSLELFVASLLVRKALRFVL